MRRESFVVGRRRLSYLVSEAPPGTGRQPPLQNLLLLHAFPLNAEMWRQQLGRPPAGWRLIAPDYRGFGQSSVSDSSPTTINDLAGDAIDLLDELDVTETVVAGCSMGGYVAFEMLSSASRYITGLILVDTRANADTEEAKVNRRKMVEALERGGSVVVADEMVPKLLGATSHRERPGLVSHIRDSIADANPEAIKMAILAMMERKDMTAQLGAIKAPTLIVAGAEDTLIPMAAVHQLRDEIKGSELVMIPQAGHLPSLEQADEFDAVIGTFLKRL
jgi:3-oxoadipate enol-lactonase